MDFFKNKVGRENLANILDNGYSEDLAYLTKKLGLEIGHLKKAKRQINWLKQCQNIQSTDYYIYHRRSVQIMYDSTVYSYYVSDNIALCFEYDGKEIGNIDFMRIVGDYHHGNLEEIV